MNISRSTSNLPLLDLQILAVGCQKLFLDLMTILPKAHVFLTRSWNSKKLLIKNYLGRKEAGNEMKNLYKCNFNKTNSRKANKTIKNFKENPLSLHCSLFLEGCGGSKSRLSYYTSRSSITPIISLGSSFK